MSRICRCLPVLCLGACMFAFCAPNGNATTIHAEAGAQNVAGGTTPGRTEILNSGATSASASYTGSSVHMSGFTLVHNGLVSASGYAGITAGGYLEMGAFSQSSIQDEDAASSGGWANWYDTWQWNAASGAPRPSSIRMVFQIDGVTSHAGQIGWSNLLQAQFFQGSTASVTYRDSGGAITYTGYNSEYASFPGTFSGTLPVPATGTVAWAIQLYAETQVIPPSNLFSTATGSATADAFHTLTLVAVTLPDGSPFTGGTFESGIVPLWQIPEPSSMLLAGLGILGFAWVARCMRTAKVK